MPHDHRERLIAALAASVEEKGYRETTVADIVRIAGTSRRSFYEHFDDRADCFLALFEATNDEVIAAIADAVDPADQWERQVNQALGAYLGAVAASPTLYRSFVRELPALGERGAAHQLAAIERFARQLVGLVELGRHQQPSIDVGPLTFDAAVIIVGGIRELMVIAAQHGRDLSELRPAIAEAVSAIVGASVVRS